MVELDNPVQSPSLFLLFMIPNDLSIRLFGVDSFPDRISCVFSQRTRLFRTDLVATQQQEDSENNDIDEERCQSVRHSALTHIFRLKLDHVTISERGRKFR